MKTLVRPLLLASLLVATALTQSGCGFRNVETPAGYVGYVTRGSLTGSSRFERTQVGPTSTGLEFLVDAINISVTPYTFDEIFDSSNSTGVLCKDKVAVSFDVHVLFRIRPDHVQDFVEKYTTMKLTGDTPEAIVQVAYNNFIKQQIRSMAREEVEKYNGLETQDHIGEIQVTLTRRALELVKTTPFELLSVVVGRISYPKAIADAVSNKIATSQVLETKSIELQIEQQEAEKRKIGAAGIASAMQMIRNQLTPEYLQYEAIKAQSAQVNSPNHTVIYIPVGPMGVPIVNTNSLSGTTLAPAATPVPNTK